MKKKTEAQPLYLRLASAANGYAKASRLRRKDSWHNAKAITDRILAGLGGAGVSNITLNWRGSCRPDKKIVLDFLYSHMDEAGSYIGESGYRAVITPSLLPPGFNVKITGRPQWVGDYLYDHFVHALKQTVE